MLEPITYLLATEANRLCQITAEATKFDEDGKPILWAVRRGSTCLNRRTLEFDYEPMPSSRTAAYFKTHRFDSPQACEEIWIKAEAKEKRRIERFEKTEN
jgi:hypothetical protein